MQGFYKIPMGFSVYGVVLCRVKVYRSCRACRSLV